MNDSSGANFAVMFMRNHEIEMHGGVNPFMSPVPHAQFHITCEYATFDSSSLSPLNSVLCVYTC